MGEAKQQISEGQKPAKAESLQPSSPQPGGTDRLTRIVLLVSPISTRPAKLLKGLYDRKIAVRIVHDAALAMAELELFDAQVLIIHEAQAVNALESLLNAVRVYHPDVLCWRHDPAGPNGRERLSSFQCALIPQASPRFTPAPADLRTETASDSHINHAAHSHDASNAANAKPKQNANASEQKPRSLDDAKHPNGSVNGHPHGHVQTNGHAQTNGHGLRADASPSSSQMSWGQRLASASGDRSAHGQSHQASDAFSPLLTPEEIELLRGPIDEGP